MMVLGAMARMQARKEISTTPNWEGQDEDAILNKMMTTMKLRASNLLLRRALLERTIRTDHATFGSTGNSSAFPWNSKSGVPSDHAHHPDNSLSSNGSHHAAGASANLGSLWVTVYPPMGTGFKPATRSTSFSSLRSEARTRSPRTTTSRGDAISADTGRAPRANVLLCTRAQCKDVYRVPQTTSSSCPEAPLVRPRRYDFTIRTDLEKEKFTGFVKIDLEIVKATKIVTFNAATELLLGRATLVLAPSGFESELTDSMTGYYKNMCAKDICTLTQFEMQLLSEANLSGLQDVVHIGTAGIVTSIEKSPPSFSIHATQVTYITLPPIIMKSSESYHKANVLSLVADIALARVARFLLANLSGEQPGAANFSFALDVDVGRVEPESTYHRPLLFGRQERTPW
ncbi:hypothetical protein EDB85DRAFT_2211058 [Lactarius pseudohatsudake]|nr:hypothetical protein EDB85DRAFT_2211058 [Lactarius pseudohatsudake]